MKKKVWTREWPKLGVSNLQSSVEYYSDKFSFELCDDRFSIKSAGKAELKLHDFHLFLIEGAKGPIYNPSEYSDEIIPNVSPTLWIPAPKPKSYFESLKSKGANLVSKNDMVDYDLEGFYVLDNEDNRIFFFRDYHGPYTPYFWSLEWEQKKTKVKWWQFRLY